MGAWTSRDPSCAWPGREAIRLGPLPIQAVLGQGERRSGWDPSRSKLCLVGARGMQLGHEPPLLFFKNLEYTAYAAYAASKIRRMSRARRPFRITPGPSTPKYTQVRLSTQGGCSAQVAHFGVHPIPLCGDAPRRSPILGSLLFHFMGMLRAGRPPGGGWWQGWKGAAPSFFKKLEYTAYAASKIRRMSRARRPFRVTPGSSTLKYAQVRLSTQGGCSAQVAHFGAPSNSI